MDPGSSVGLLGVGVGSWRSAFAGRWRCRGSIACPVPGPGRWPGSPSSSSRPRRSTSWFGSSRAPQRRRHGQLALPHPPLRRDRRGNAAAGWAVGLPVVAAERWSSPTCPHPSSRRPADEVVIGAIW